MIKGENSKKLWRKIFEDCQNIKGEIIITVKKYRHQRSWKQNAYYRGHIIPIIASELGYSNDEMHSILKYKFLQDKTKDMYYIKSTKELDTKEFVEYIENIRNWASSELSIQTMDAEMFYNLNN